MTAPKGSPETRHLRRLEPEATATVVLWWDDNLNNLDLKGILKSQISFEASIASGIGLALWFYTGLEADLKHYRN